MLVHTALNKTIHTALDPYFCHAGTPIWQTFSLLSSYFTPPAANIAKLFMWVKQVPPSSRDSTNKSTISREGLTPNYCMFTLINNISLTYLSLALRPMPVGLWVRESNREEVDYRLSATFPFGLNDNAPRPSITHLSTSLIITSPNHNRHLPLS